MKPRMQKYLEDVRELIAKATSPAHCSPEDAMEFYEEVGNDMDDAIEELEGEREEDEGWDGDDE